ncbi:MAG TPA: LapA family protein [Pseudolabrys sp.]|nr:LapA family protein [Pseudolabrys sp.]
MFRKIVLTIILVPLAIIIVAFAVANRETVRVIFDPFDQANPAYSASLPLWLLVFLLVSFGVIVGGIAAWLRQSKWRRLARRLDSEVRELRREMQTIDARQTLSSAPPATQPAPLSIAPPT